MQDFYILQRTPTVLNSKEIRRWYITVDMLAPDNIIMGDDQTNNFMLASQDKELLYIVPLVRHLTEEEAERIVEGYMRVSEHDFQIETSNVYRANADFGHPFETDYQIAVEAKNVLKDAYARQRHNSWIQEQMDLGFRYGLNFNIKEKTHPAMRPWDDLPESYRRMPETTDKELLDFYSQNITKFG
ncbi:MAG: hypothetical protein CBC57_05745 [Euryarchaeota archaeon TMED97]|nr:MAG: hypothetical protein CBC57_05745 [Euryarchaeota archaeon TMED97]|tara:strand:- start:44 stop:601 length:558 start_codon:yes stop_codon:yes gene_type:complete